MPENSAPPDMLTNRANPDATSRSSSDICDKRSQHSPYVAYVGLEPQEKVIVLSRGDGRLQRRILTLLEQSPERKKNREDLDEVLVEEGYDPSNILRAIKGLARKHRVGFTDRPHKRDSLVTLPSPPRPVSDDEVFALLRQINDASAEAKR